MYLLVKGSIGIFLPTNETKTPNFIIQENELFGEMGVIENELRMATARCLKDSEIISITKDEFDKRVNSSDVFVKGSLKALSYRLRSVEKNEIKAKLIGLKRLKNIQDIEMLKYF